MKIRKEKREEHRIVNTKSLHDLQRESRLLLERITHIKTFSNHYRVCGVHFSKP